MNHAEDEATSSRAARGAPAVIGRKAEDVAQSGFWPPRRAAPQRSLVCRWFERSAYPTLGPGPRARNN
eukprot:11191474-Alexandrium_andersonii.AAC.1